MGPFNKSLAFKRYMVGLLVPLVTQLIAWSQTHPAPPIDTTQLVQAMVGGFLTAVAIDLHAWTTPQEPVKPKDPS